MCKNRLSLLFLPVVMKKSNRQAWSCISNGGTFQRQNQPFSRYNEDEQTAQRPNHVHPVFLLAERRHKSPSLLHLHHPHHHHHHHHYFPCRKASHFHLNYIGYTCVIQTSGPAYGKPIRNVCLDDHIHSASRLWQYRGDFQR